MSTGNRRKSEDNILLGANLAKRRDQAGLIQSELAEALGVSEGAVANWESGRNWTDDRTLQKIADILKVSVDVLRDPRGGSNVSPSDKQPNPMMAPVVSWVRAGEGRDYADLREFVDEWKRKSANNVNEFYFRIEGESMAPRYEEGDYISVLPGDDLVNAQPVVARYIDGRLMLKVFYRVGGKYRFVSLNSDFEPFDEEPSEFEYIYPVGEHIKAKPKFSKVPPPLPTPGAKKEQ